MTDEQFADAWAKSKDKFYRFAFCYVKNETDALEILSKSTCKAYCALGKLKNNNYFDSWMGKIIMNTAIDYLKHKKKIVPIEEYLPNCTVQKETFEIEERLDLYAALDLISGKDKAFLIYKYFEQKSFREIADIMDMPESTVKSRIYRVLKVLRTYLQKENLYDRG